MPLYDFVCSRCSKNFEEIIYGTRTPACPTCAQTDEVSRIPFGSVTVGRKEDLRPPNIKGRLRPPRR